MTAHRRGMVLALVAVLLLPTGVGAQGPVGIDVTGATYAELDDGTGIWTLRGDPVSVRRGAATLQAAGMTYDTRDQVLRAEGGVRYTEPDLSLEAAQITAHLREQRLLATGSPVVTTAQGRLTGERIEVLGDREEVSADGGARLVSGDIEGHAPRLVLQRRVAVATFSGGAVVRQGRHEIQAQTIVVDLRRRRATARGGARVTVQTDR